MTKATLSAAALVLAGAAFGQTSEHKQRSDNQQDRVAQGVKSGQLTPRETANLEKKEAGINKEVRTDKAADGGHLTVQQKAAVNRQQSRESKQIYADKHNTSTEKYGNNSVGARRENQQDRIASGIASGKMNAGEAAGVERQQTNTNQQIRADRTKNGGVLTPAEKAPVNRAQNRDSKQIYADKHNQ